MSKKSSFFLAVILISTQTLQSAEHSPIRSIPTIIEPTCTNQKLATTPNSPSKKQELLTDSHKIAPLQSSHSYTLVPSPTQSRDRRDRDALLTARTGGERYVAQDKDRALSNPNLDYIDQELKKLAQMRNQHSSLTGLIKLKKELHPLMRGNTRQYASSAPEIGISHTKKSHLSFENSIPLTDSEDDNDSDLQD